jgi:hypothetical protein
MSGAIVFFVLGVFGLGMFSDTIVGATDRLGNLLDIQERIYGWAW